MIHEIRWVTIQANTTQYCITDTYVYVGSRDPPGVIILTSGQHATYTVVKDFNHYLYMAPDSKVTFKSQAKDASININKNIWGGGTIEISCNLTVNSSFGPPKESELDMINALPRYQYQGKIINETIL